MRTCFASGLTLLMVFVSTATGDEKADLKAMVGKWTIVKAELGKTDIFELLKTLEFEIREDGKYTAKLGDETDNGSFTVDPSKSPKEMDIKATGGPNKGKTIKALYKQDGDTLTICYNLGGGDRPTAFETKPDTKLYLAVYKLKK